MVLRWSDGSYLEDQDMWWLSGIYRSVYLLNKPAAHITDMRVDTQLRDGYSRGSLRIEAMTSQAEHLSLRARLYWGERLIVEQTRPLGTAPVDEKGGYSDRFPFDPGWGHRRARVQFERTYEQEAERLLGLA